MRQSAHSHQVAELWLTGIGTMIVTHQVPSSLHSSRLCGRHQKSRETRSDTQMRVSQALPIVVGAHLAHDTNVLEHRSWQCWIKLIRTAIILLKLFITIIIIIIIIIIISVIITVIINVMNKTVSYDEKLWDVSTLGSVAYL